MIWKRQNLKISNRFGKDAKNNRSDSKHGTFRKYGQPPIDTPEETSAIPFKKMKPKNEAYNILYIRKKWLCNKIGYTEKMEKRILWEEQNHTNTATTPFLEKEDYTTGKTTRIHSEKSRRLKRTAALETKDPNSYIPIYSPKRLGRMGRQQGERTHYPTRWCVNEPDAWFSSQRTVVRSNKKQAYLKGVAGVRELRVRYRKTARKRLTQLYLHSLFGLIYFLILSMMDSYGCTGRILQPSWWNIFV